MHLWKIWRRKDAHTAYNTEKYTEYPKQSICYDAYEWNTRPT